MIELDGHRVFNPAYLWYLESDARDDWQRPAEVIAALELEEGDSIADIGAGGGYFTEKFSRTVGEDGRVYAVDVQDVMIARLENRVAEKDLRNVRVIKAEFETPLLPAESIDIAFFCSVYKEIDERIEYMKKVRKALKRGGRVAIIEFHKERGVAGPEFNDRMSDKQVTEELNEAGFFLIQRYDFLPREYFLVFGIAGGE
jgi:ubiquinone/menaquinone biosynthesis C-methylase UbiE